MEKSSGSWGWPSSAAEKQTPATVRGSYELETYALPAETEVPAPLKEQHHTHDEALRGQNGFADLGTPTLDVATPDTYPDEFED